MSKKKFAEILEEAMGKEVKIKPTNTYSPRHIDQYVGLKGIVINYDLGDDSDNVIVCLDDIVADKKKVEGSIWLDVRDIIL